LASFVRNEFMRDKVALYIGPRIIKGRPEQFHDILDALYATGEPGKTLDVVVRDWGTRVRNDIRSRAHAAQNMTSSQYIQMVIEEQLLQLRDDDAGEKDWQRWGTYPRMMRVNKEKFLRTEIIGERDADGRGHVSRLDEAVSELVNDPEKGIGFAKMVLKQMRIILTEPAHPYQKLFESDVNQLQKTVGQRRKAYQDTLNELRLRETEGSLKRALFPGTIPHLETVTIENFQEYMLTAVKLRSRKEAIDICIRVLEHVGDESHVIDEKRRTEETGLMRKLTELENSLAELKSTFDARKEEFSKPEQDALTLTLYEPNDVDQEYYPHYVGATEADQAMFVSQRAKEILDDLPSIGGADKKGLKVMDLPVLVDQFGKDRVVRMFLERTSRQFRDIEKDFEVL
jgi:hypothetical protein